MRGLLWDDWEPHERLVIAFFVFLFAGVIVQKATEPPIPTDIVSVAVERGYFPCAHEDSPGPCYWDASVRGNGQGRSFVITDDGEVFYDD